MGKLIRRSDIWPIIAKGGLHLTSDYAANPQIPYPVTAAKRRGHFTARMWQRQGRAVSFRNHIIPPWQAKHQRRPDWIRRQQRRLHGGDPL